MKGSKPHARPLLPPPMTVGRYVRHRYEPLVRKHLAYANFGVPMVVLARMAKDGFSWKFLAMGLAAYVLVAILILVVVGLALVGAGWWKLHTKINPYIPVTIAMVAAVLGYILVFNFY